MRRGGVNYYYHGDDMHNVVKLTDSDGQVVEGYDYGDYGTPEFYDANGALTGATASAFGNPYLFTGREWDEELGLYYYRNRYMDPGLGRFVSRDPLGLWGDPLNLGNGYTYAASNPWTLVDPFGLAAGNSNRLPRWGERSYLEEVFAVGKGYFWDPTVGTAIGIVRAAINYEDTFTSAKDTLNFALEDPRGFRDAVGKGISQGIENALENPESAGTATSGLATTVLGGYGMAKGAANATKTTVDVAGDAARAATKTRVLSNIAESQVRNSRVFWSGRGSREAAEVFAKSNGGRTLEMTRLGGALDRVTTPGNFKYMKPLWNFASSRFANGAKGPVNVIHSSKGVRIESVWATREYKILKQNGNEIRYHSTE